MAQTASETKTAELALHVEIEKHRQPEHPVHRLFINRWSPRAMTGEEISNETLMTLFEAARWAPSSYNNQPARFIYAKRNTPGWQKIFNLMAEFNQSWTKNAAVIMVIISKKTFDYNGKPAPTHSYDAGAAWENLALQGSLLGLVVHGMQGFDFDKAKKDLNIPDDYQVEAMAAVGKLGRKEDLPAEMQEREFPSDRKKVEQIAFEVDAGTDIGSFLGSSRKS